MVASTQEDPSLKSIWDTTKGKKATRYKQCIFLVSLYVSVNRVEMSEFDTTLQCIYISRILETDVHCGVFGQLVFSLGRTKENYLIIICTQQIPTNISDTLFLFLPIYML